MPHLHQRPTERYQPSSSLLPWPKSKEAIKTLPNQTALGTDAIKPPVACANVKKESVGSKNELWSQIGESNTT